MNNHKLRGYSLSITIESILSSLELHRQENGVRDITLVDLYQYLNIILKSVISWRVIKCRVNIVCLDRTWPHLADLAIYAGARVIKSNQMNTIRCDQLKVPFSRYKCYLNYLNWVQSLLLRTCFFQNAIKISNLNKLATFLKEYYLRYLIQSLNLPVVTDIPWFRKIPKSLYWILRKCLVAIGLLFEKRLQERHEKAWGKEN